MSLAMYVPIGGVTVCLNAAQNPNTDSDAFGKGWLVKVKLNGDLSEGLLDEAGYRALTEGANH